MVDAFHTLLQHFVPAVPPSISALGAEVDPDRVAAYEKAAAQRYTYLAGFRSLYNALHNLTKPKPARAEVGKPFGELLPEPE